MPIPLTCDDPIATLDGSNSDNGSNITYQWTAIIDGNILSGETTNMPQVDAPGTYELLVTNTDNGCVGADLIVIE